MSVMLKCGSCLGAMQYPSSALHQPPLNKNLQILWWGPGDPLLLKTFWSLNPEFQWDGPCLIEEPNFPSGSKETTINAMPRPKYQVYPSKGYKGFPLYDMKNQKKECQVLFPNIWSELSHTAYPRPFSGMKDGKNTKKDTSWPMLPILMGKKAPFSNIDYHFVQSRGAPSPAECRKWWVSNWRKCCDVVRKSLSTALEVKRLIKSI